MSEIQKKNKTKLIQVERLLKPDRLPTEVDNEIEIIDLSSLTDVTPEEDAELLSLNHRFVVNHPVKWEINGSGGSRKIYQDGSIEFNEIGSGPYHEVYPKCDTQRCDICSPHRTPPYRTITGEKIKPTQITSLLSQNLEGTSRSPNFCYLWDQTDEGYYKAEAKKGLPEFIAATRENYYYIPEDSGYRGRFKCPKREENVRGMGTSSEGEPFSYDNHDDYDNCDDENWRTPTPEWKKGDILIYVNPKTGQAEYYCPRCSRANSKYYGGDSKPVKHTIPRKLRDELAADHIIPSKEYKYKDRTLEVDTVLALVTKNPGISYYRLDKESRWPKGTAERLINNHLKGKVRVLKGKRGYRVYPA